MLLPSSTLPQVTRRSSLALVAAEVALDVALDVQLVHGPAVLRLGVGLAVLAHG